MVFIAFNDKNKIIFANNSSKGKYVLIKILLRWNKKSKIFLIPRKYVCVFCNDNIFYVKKSIDNKIEHFRHSIKCKYAESINKNYGFYINDFHFKWTRNIKKNVNIK